MKTVKIIILCITCLCCGGQQSDKLFYPARDLGKIDKELDEASGLVASVSNPGKLWTINDSGNDAKVYLIDQQAKIVLTCTLDRAENRDWEDISIGNGPEPGVNYVYVGDIGDNHGRHDLKYVYRFREPKEADDRKIRISQIDTLILQLPGKPRDTETLMADPLSGDLYIVSKREDSVRLYCARYPFAKGTILMEMLAKLPFTLIVAGSISPDGHEILLKNYNKIYYWKRFEGEAVVTALLREPVRLSYEPEHQGEAIAWARDSTGFYTLSESSVVDRATLKFFRRR